MTQNLFDKVGEMAEKFKSFFSSKKKCQALQNYSTAAPFQHKEYLNLIKKCMGDGFIGEKESEFLGYMIEKYEVNYLDWSHKTKWLKGEIVRLSAHYQKKEAEKQAFDFSRFHSKMSSNVPFELLAQHQKQQQQGRRF